MELETFDHIPALNEILRGDGLPGYTYYYVLTANQGTAQEIGLKPTDKTNTFRITGPKGAADTILMCEGSRIPGASPAASKQDVKVDGGIYSTAGLLTPNEEQELANTKQKAELATTAKKATAAGGVTVQGDATGPVSTEADIAAMKEDQGQKRGGKRIH